MPSRLGEIGQPGIRGTMFGQRGYAARRLAAAASSGGGAWGSITGTLASQTDLQSALDAKADTPTGTPDGTKFLRDDNTWQATPGGGSGLTHPQVLARGLGA